MPLVVRRALPDDAVALRDVERAANLIALRHVFGDEPFPDDAVLERWESELAEPGVQIWVAEDAHDTTTSTRDHHTLVWAVAHEPDRVRHLAVAPDRWGRGLGSEALAHAVEQIRAAGFTTAYLWCLDANTRARRLYERHGWRLTGRTMPAEWPPYPVELEYALDLAPPTP